MALDGMRGIDARRTRLPPRPLAPRRGLPAGFQSHRVTAPDGDVASLLAPWVGTARVIGIEGRRVVELFEVVVGWLRIGYLTLPDGARVDAVHVPDHQLVVVPVDGELHVTTDEVEVRATSTRAACPVPGRPVTLRRRGDGPIMLVAVSIDGLRRGTDVLLGRTPNRSVGFDPAFDLLAPGAQRWQTAVALLHAEVAALDGGHPGPELLPVASLVTTTLLLVHGRGVAAVLGGSPALHADRALRRAVDHALSNLTDPLRVDEIAAAGGMSVRSLQASFRQVFDQTPTAWLRDRRLERARDELVRASISEATVTEVALRWQFSNPGRFAAAYRERFGELPSATLAR